MEQSLQPVFQGLSGFQASGVDRLATSGLTVALQLAVCLQNRDCDEEERPQKKAMLLNPIGHFDQRQRR